MAWCLLLVCIMALIVAGSGLRGHVACRPDLVDVPESHYCRRCDTLAASEPPKCEQCGEPMELIIR